MKENNEIRNKWLHLRLSEAEYQILHKQFSKSIERSLSKYARKIIMGEPMIRGYRNLSLDTLIAEFSILNKTLNGIGNNYNQTVHKLHTLAHYPDIRIWLSKSEKDHEQLLVGIDEIKAFIRKNAEQWLQS